MSRELNEESAKKFYEVTENMLEQLAHSQGIDDLSEYYELTDFKIGAYGELLKNYGDSISGVFMQMAFHAQNASRLDTIVKFLDKWCAGSLLSKEFRTIIKTFEITA